MNIYQFPTTCDVCGGNGKGTIRTATASWDPYNEVRHKNPRVCADNLAQRASELDQKEHKLNKS